MKLAPVLLFAAAVATVPAAAVSVAHGQAAKTVKACNEEYKANKPAIRAAKEKKADFIAACRALPPGTPTPIGTAPAAPTPPQPAPASNPQPTPAPPPPAPSQRTQSPPPTAPAGEDACANGYAHLPASHTATQFCTPQAAQGRCPGRAVVWVNTKSKIYHFPGQRNYGHTKEGAYQCQTDADAEGARPTKNGQ